MALGMVDGLSVSRRRLWQSARQRRAGRVIAQPGATGRRQENFYGIVGLPNQKHDELIGRMNKSRDGESHFAIGQSVSDCYRAAWSDKAGRLGGVACLRRCVAPK